MPVAAAGQAEVVTADLDPLEVRRGGQHPAQQLAVEGLDAGLLAQRQPRLGDPLRQLVPQPLELAEVENPRLDCDRGDAIVELDASEGLAQEAGELTLEPADLASQLDPGKALVDVDAERRRAVSIEQIRHRPASECRSPPCRRKPEDG